MNFPSKLVERAVEQVSRLPSIGPKSALRIVMQLLKADPSQTDELAEALRDLRHNIQYCQKCHAISDGPVCNTCLDVRREQSVICVVEQTRDVLAIENTNQYKGLYHVLGGVISPIEGIGPSDLYIASLLSRIAQEEVKEVILALSTTMEGDTTAFYLAKKIREQGVKVSTIARGIPMGGELEYADELTLGRSIMTRRELDS